MTETVVFWWMVGLTAWLAWLTYDCRERNRVSEEIRDAVDSFVEALAKHPKYPKDEESKRD